MHMRRYKDNYWLSYEELSIFVFWVIIYGPSPASSWHSGVLELHLFVVNYSLLSVNIAKEIEGKHDIEIEWKIQYFDSELVQGLTNYNYIWRKKIGKW